MPTRPLPPGTCNFPVNLPVDLRRDAGRLAYAADKSLGAWLREMVAVQVSDAYAKGHLIDRSAQRSLELGLCALFAAGVGFVAAAALSGDSEPRAFRRPGRRRDNIAFFCPDESGKPTF